MKSIKEYLNEGLIKRQAGMDMRAKIEEWLESQKILNYTLNDDLTIDVKGSVYLSRTYREKQLPDYIQFGIVNSSFDLSQCRTIESLKGCPKEVGGDFDCQGCFGLKSLEGAPQKVSGSFHCSYCTNLTSLKGAPQEVGGSFNCYDCGKEFTEDDVKKVSNVKRKIFT